MTVFYSKKEGGRIIKAVIRSSKKVTLKRIKKIKSIVIDNNRTTNLRMPNCQVVDFGSKIIIVYGKNVRKRYKAACKLFKHKTN